MKTEKEVTADYEWRNGWNYEDPSVFKMTVVVETEFAKACPTMLGDFQLANGHGQDKASHVLRVSQSICFHPLNFTFCVNNNIFRLYFYTIFSCHQFYSHEFRLCIGTLEDIHN